MTTRPTRRDLACLPLYGLILALFLVPRYLAGGTLYFSAPHEFSGIEIHAAFQLANRALWSEGVPLWNPWSGCGTPHLANLQSAVFFPLHWLFLVLPPLSAAEVALVARLLLAAVFAHALGRALGLSTPAACFVAIAYSLNAWELRFANNAYGNGVLLLPATCHAFLRLGATGGRGPLLASMATVALLALAGLPEAAAFTVLTATVFLVLGALRGGRGRPLWRTPALLAAALAGGLALAAVQVLPFLEYLGQCWSTHLGAVDFRDRAMPAETAFGIAFPFTDPTLSVRETALTPGVVVVSLAALGLLARERGALTPLLGAFVLLGALKLFGVQPVHALGRLPLVETLNFPLYAPPGLHLCLAILAAVGLDGLRRGTVPAAVPTLLAIGGLLAVLWALAPHPTPRGAYAWAMLAVTAAVVIVGSGRPRGARRVPPGIAPGAATAALLALLVAELWLHDTRVPLETTLFESAYGEPLETSGGEIGAFLRDALGDQQRFWLAGTRLPNIALFWGPVRGFGYKDAIQVDRYWNYSVNAPELWGYGPADEREEEDTRLLDLAAVGVVVVQETSLERSTDLMRRVVDRGLRSFDGPGPVSIEPLRARDRQPAVLARPPFTATLRRFELGSFERLRLFLGVEGALAAPLTFRLRTGRGERSRLLLERTLAPGEEGWHDVRVDLPADLPRGSLVLETSGGAGATRAGFGGLRLGRSGGLQTATLRPLARVPPYQVFENPAALPRARVVHEAVVVARRDVERTLEDPAFDARRAVVLESEPPLALAGAPGPSTARIVTSRPRHVAVEVEAAAAGLLVLADTCYPGWSATVDGEERPILPANLMFRAVPVPAGSHLVEFRYDPWSFRLGALVSVCALAAAVASALWPRRRPQRGAATP